MNNIKNYFASPIKLPRAAEQLTPQKVAVAVHPPHPLSDMSQLQANNSMKIPSTKETNKLIVSNMESVISLVKKTHKAKKKKRKEIEPEICDISNILTNSLCFVSPKAKLDDDTEDLQNIESENIVTKSPNKKPHDVKQIKPNKFAHKSKYDENSNEPKATAAMTDKKPQPTTLTDCNSELKESTTAESTQIIEPIEKEGTDKESTSTKESNKSETKNTEWTEERDKIIESKEDIKIEEKKIPESSKDSGSESIESNKDIGQKEDIKLEKKKIAKSNKDSNPNSGSKSEGKKKIESNKEKSEKKDKKKLKEKSNKSPTQTAERTKDVSETKPTDTSTRTPPKKLNAFALMMNARTKSIGTNSPGKVDMKLVESTVEKPNSSSKIKRKLMLEEWADRKGGQKRKLQEADSEEYVNRKMDKRAKRLKKLIKNGCKQENDTKIEATEEDEVEGGNSSVFIKLSIKKKKKKKPVNKIESSEDDEVEVVDENVVEEAVVKNVIAKSPKNTSPKLNGFHKSPVEKKEDQNFVEVLASPTKKRDSLLGYFSKIAKTPTNSPEIVEVKLTPIESKVSKAKHLDETPTTAKKRGRPSKSKLKPDEETPEVNLPETNQSPCNSKVISDDHSVDRPRRSCREKTTCYKFDDSPIKGERTKKRARRLISDSEDDEPEKIKKNVKKPTAPLASIFIKSFPKPAIDPEIVRARQAFLMSGIPEKMKLDIERQRAFEECYEVDNFVYFPTISHVQQFEPDFSAMEQNVYSFTFKQTSPERPIHINEFKCGIGTMPVTLLKRQLCFAPAKTADKSQLGKEIVTQLKDNDSDKFQYYRCFKQLRKKSCLPIVEEKSVIQLDDSIELIISTPPSTAKNCTESTFTDDYKPNCLNEVIVNSCPVAELKKFLSTWLENNNERRNYNSDDDFDTNSNSVSGVNKACVLVGPSGSGKTNAVYLLANEMNFKVLEINAGGKRTGKKILQELQEATQSHHVKGGAGAGLTASQRLLSQSDDASEQSQKLSLILIEDADVVFEQDFGFVDAINQLVSTSKRPVIMISNQLNCSHLTRFIANNSIEFKPANSKFISKWLSIMSVVEQCYIDAEQCERLYLRNNCDLRRTMLEIQFFILSGGDCKRSAAEEPSSHKGLVDFYTRNQNDAGAIPTPINLDNFAKIINTKMCAKFQQNQGGDLTGMLDVYENLSFAEYYENRHDRIEQDRTVLRLNEKLSSYVVLSSFEQYFDDASYCRDDKLFFDLIVEPSKSSVHAITPSMVGSTTNLIGNRNKYLDYEPSLRAICRSEHVRTQTERRGSRFYHYLRNSMINNFSFSTAAFDGHCAIFAEELKNVCDEGDSK